MHVFGRPLKEGIDVESQSVVRRKKPVLTLALLVAIAAALATLPALAVATMTAVVPANVSGPMRVDALSAPESVDDGEPINVRVTLAGEVVGPLTVNLQYAAYFRTVSAGAQAMTPVGGRAFEATIPGFPDGTEVWIVAGVTSGTREPVISESYTVRVGAVPRDGPSGLSVYDVTHFQDFPSPQSPVTIEATVQSGSPVTHVDVAYMAFCAERVSTPIDPAMTMAAPQRYSITITTPDPCSWAPSATLLYRVLAVDASGNTAVSDVFTVEMAGQMWRQVP